MCVNTYVYCLQALVGHDYLTYEIDECIKL